MFTPFKVESHLRWYNTWWSPFLRAFTVKWNAHMNWVCQIRESGGAPGTELRTTALDKVGWQGTMWTNTIKKNEKRTKRRMCIAYTHTVFGKMCNLHCVKRRFSAPVVAKHRAQWCGCFNDTLCSATPRLVSRTEDAHIWLLTSSHTVDCQCKMFTLEF